MKTRNLKVLFFGTPAFGATILEALCTYNFNVVGVMTQITRQKAPGSIPLPSEVRKVADKHKLLVFQPATDDEIIKTTKHINPDIVIIAAYGKIIPLEVLETPSFGALNVHGSLLPKYRGASPIPAAILNGDKETGITIMKVTKGMDEGPIISQAKIPIKENDTTETLYQKLASIGADELIRVLPLYVDGLLKAKDQNHKQATYCSVIKKENGNIDWLKPAKFIERMTRAYVPWPKTYTYWEDKTLIVTQAKAVTKVLEPGYVLVVDKKLIVGCGKDSLEIYKLQPEGKNELSAAEFINGYKDIDGVTLK